MPTYSYLCNDCNSSFELFFYIKDYVEKPSCCYCSSNSTSRLITNDVLTQSCSVKKSDTELKTLGDLAQRNSERMSDDQKISLYNKHNSYKIGEDQKELSLPKGMQRVKKPPKIKWPGSSNKKRRKLKDE